MHYIFSPQPALQREHRQNRQRHIANLAVSDREPRQGSEHNVGDQCSSQAIHLLPTPLQMVHREGFEPSYLARRDRFTVCWL
jgi:hypothetical protein